MKRFILLFYASLLALLAFGQEQSDYSFEPDLFNASTAAKLNYYSIGLYASNPIAYVNPNFNFWASGHLQQNFGFLSRLGLSSYKTTDYSTLNSNVNLGFYYNFIFKHNKNLSFGFASQYDKTLYQDLYGSQTYYNIDLIPSISYFNKTLTISASLLNLSIAHDSLSSTSKPKTLLLYGDAIFSNVIKTYSLQPSIFIGIGRAPMIGTSANLLLSKVLLIGLGQITTIYTTSGMYGYFNVWLQGGFKIKDKFYLYLKANEYIYGLSPTSPILSFALKYHIFGKNSNTVPRYF